MTRVADRLEVIVVREGADGRGHSVLLPRIRRQLTEQVEQRLRRDRARLRVGERRCDEGAREGIVDAPEPPDEDSGRLLRGQLLAP